MKCHKHKDEEPTCPLVGAGDPWFWFRVQRSQGLWFDRSSETRIDYSQRELRALHGELEEEPARSSLLPRLKPPINVLSSCSGLPGVLVLQTPFSNPPSGECLCVPPRQRGRKE